MMNLLVKDVLTFFSYAYDVRRKYHHDLFVEEYSNDIIYINN